MNDSNSENGQTVLSEAGADGLRVVLASDRGSTVLVIAVDNRAKLCAFWGKEAYTLDVEGNTLLAQSLMKAAGVVTASIAVECQESYEPEDLKKLLEVHPATHQKISTPLVAARFWRFFRQLIRAWDKPHALDDAAKRGARLLVGVRTVEQNKIEVIFEERWMESLDASGKMSLRWGLEKAAEVAEIKGELLGRGAS